MSQVKVIFTKFGANSAVGGFEPGSTARVPQPLADHFVEIGVAKFAESDAGGGRTGSKPPHNGPGTAAKPDGSGFQRTGATDVPDVSGSTKAGTVKGEGKPQTLSAAPTKGGKQNGKK